ncbi:fibronectin type III domain-containing protein [Candidatus Nitrospira neomarina]|uniref:Fibronectin type III domain-containing protein n=1 Tax=Candidatus Nitrospira neomarina TaxID=3020899 RepID=A0AA96GMS5_9BACT|nr:fibronectin type III domain-containing protein [Candidatus Nitrospira neomarina]WNM62043.1 fibronectin type III domain-containing protein [Candidatus Nitrospira neomarina]
MLHNQGFSRITFPRTHSFPFALSALWTVVVFLCLFSSNALAGEVTLAWNPPSAEYGGFIVAYGTSSGSYTETQDVGAQAMYTVTSLNPGQTYYFAVKAYDRARKIESPFSNQVSVTLPIGNARPAPPKDVKVY